MNVCKDCAFFYVGHCRRSPPQVVFEGSVMGRARTQWPEVDEYDWCGEFKATKAK
jgi:hypothetical protein